MYGIMFGSVAWPEQFSPHEWRQLTIRSRRAPPVVPRLPTARWFAPFFARTFGVPPPATTATPPCRRGLTLLVGGRTPSARHDRLYLVATPVGRPRVAGSIRKYLGRRSSR